jgi:phosphoribosylaminoimidazole-succinocarboxamide synthase
VRDIYDLGDKLLIIATDRISAFDSILGTPIPDKGRVLTQLTLFWMEKFPDIINNHLLTTSVAELPLPGDAKECLEGRSMIVRKAKPLPIECVVRGYIIGSGWKEYKEKGTVCGIALKPGMKMAEKLDEAIFTPSTKAESGHDENISIEQAAALIGKAEIEKVRDSAIALYSRAAEYARSRGVIIADTKFEFGVYDGEIILIDEALTPDSSRFWPADSYQAGISPPSYDKQFLRDWLENESGWNKEPPAPALPLKIVEVTRSKYLEALERLTK